MRRAPIYLAAVMAVSGAGLISRGLAADPPANPGMNSAPTDATPATPANTVADNTNGNKAAVPAPDADDIRKTVASITEYAVTKGDFNKLRGYFVEADSDRIGKFEDKDKLAALDGRIDQFQKDWKSKYNEDFSFSSKRDNVLNNSFARITQGEIGEARTASGTETPSNDPQNVKGGSPEDLKRSGASQTDANSDKYFGGDTKREPGRNIATVTIFAMNTPAGSPPAVNQGMTGDLSIPLIHQLPDSWKVDVPDSMDSQKLYDNVLKQLTAADENRANWPADVNDAYRDVTRHIMMAVTDSDNAR
jgi:hypothetical protein